MTLDNFNFAFTLFGLVLGLALAEVLGGFVRVLRADAPVRIGWASPMLALVVALDLISFWLGAWEDRAGIAINFRTLVFGTVLSGIYYCAANLVFPSRPEEWPDLDDWFARQKTKVAGGIFVANLLFSLGEVLVFGTWSVSLVGRISQVVYLSLALSLVFARRGGQSVAILAGLLAFFAYLLTRTG